MAAYILQVLEKSVSPTTLPLFRKAHNQVIIYSKALEFNLCLYSYQQNEDHKVLVSYRDAI